MRGRNRKEGTALQLAKSQYSSNSGSTKQNVRQKTKQLKPMEKVHGQYERAGAGGLVQVVDGEGGNVAEDGGSHITVG